MTPQERLIEIKKRLEEALKPTKLEIEDQSALHSGHKGNIAGGGHYRALIVSSLFEGKKLLERHKMVYKALGDLQGTEIHAFSMKTLAPGEE